MGLLIVDRVHGCSLEGEGVCMGLLIVDRVHGCARRSVLNTGGKNPWDFGSEFVDHVSVKFSSSPMMHAFRRNNYSINYNI